jgi:hypothetical protein
MARQIVNLDKLGEAQKTPIEADFEVTKADDTQIEVTFRPTESRFTFGRQEPSGEVSPVAKVRHGPPGDTDGYPKRQVHHLAYRLAERRRGSVGVSDDQQRSVGPLPATSHTA